MSFNNVSKTLTIDESVFTPLKKPYQRVQRLTDYELLQKLGSGAQGDVWKAINHSGEVVALKLVKVKPGKESTVLPAKKEIEFLTEVSNPTCNPFLVCYRDSFYEPVDELFVIETDFIDGTDIDDFIYPILDSGDHKKVYLYLLLIVKDLVEALLYINKRNIFHNDIKPGNIMIDKNMTPKLVDFGLACHDKICLTSDLRCCPGFSGTAYFVAPETLIDQTRYETSDIWSLAMTLYTLATKQYPFKHRGPLTSGMAMRLIKNHEPLKLKTSNNTLNYIVNRGLDKNPETRITAEDIKDILSEN